jgi:Putative Flp pilus-assembly TadE/G-like
MKKPIIRKSKRADLQRKHERGVTMVLVALAMVAIVAMAALSIDVVTLYLAREEAQRSADSAALAAANIISLSGLTGDPTNSTSNWAKVCGPDNGTDGLAGRVAKAVATQDAVGGLAATTVNVTYSAQASGTIGAGASDCTTLALSSFGVNPIVTVRLTRSSLPSFFSRIWGNTGNQIGASATAEVLNSSNSASVTVAGTIIPVKPRCVKPWVVPNQDPRNLDGCTGQQAAGTCTKFVDPATGAIQHQGMSLNGTGTTGTVGETFWLEPDCGNGSPGFCRLHTAGTLQPEANYPTGTHPPPNLLYVPGQVTTTPVAVPSCTTGDQFEEAIEGCDQPTNYSCGVAAAGNEVDLTINPKIPTRDGVSCLIRQGNVADTTTPSGQDYLSSAPLGTPTAYPYQMLAGSANPNGIHDVPITMSSSIVSLPIYDNTVAVTSNLKTAVTFVGFLQVFINAVDQNGNINVTVLNVAGCSNGSGDPVGTAQIGNSPVPVRLITPP